MSDFTFTNLPWRYDPEGDVDGDPRCDDRATVGIDHFVVDCTGAVIACPPTEAEARAMVALPDLYAALEAAVDAWGSYPPHTASNPYKALMQGRAALANARGEEVTQ